MERHSEIHAGHLVFRGGRGTVRRMSAMDSLRAWARALKRDVVALWLAAGDPRVPFLAKAVAAATAAYALSPIDLIPDFIPVLGLLDDLILVPGGIWLALRLIPPRVMDDLRRAAGERIARAPASWTGAVVIVALWLLAAVFAGRWLWERVA